MLDIIVTHYNEEFRVGKKFFDMLGCQRGIDFADIRVILVHDGSGKFPERYFRDYPYLVAQHCIPHGGVSAARNYGIDAATAKWVQFCDFDDMYAGPYALVGILPHLKRDIDFVWTDFYVEHRKDGQLVLTTKGENLTFIHGKYYRREWLNENGLRFPEDIRFSEDSAFGAVVNALLTDGRNGHIKTPSPPYVWCERPDSVSMDPANEERNLNGFIDRNFYVVEEFKRRGIPHRLMVGRMFADAYFSFHRKDRQFPEWEKYFIGEARKYLPDLETLDANDMGPVMAVAEKFVNGTIDPEAETFGQWITKMRLSSDRGA